MKKTIAILLIILSFLIIYFLQQNVFTWFTISKISPNLFVILILIIGLFAGKKIGFILGVIFGMYLDITCGKLLGQTALMLGIIGILGEHWDKKYTKESRISLMLMVSIATLIYEFGVYAFSVLKFGSMIEITQFLKILFIEIIYNLIIIIIIYPLIQKLGSMLEETFKEKRIITKYY